MQIRTLPRQREVVLDGVLVHARHISAAGSIGRTKLALMARRCVSWDAGFMPGRTRSAELLDATVYGEARVDALEGETWARLVSRDSSEDPVLPAPTPAQAPSAT